MSQFTDPQDHPLPFELFHTFPVGSLSFLAGTASVISSEHGVETARQLFALLANSEAFWAELSARFETAAMGSSAPELGTHPPEGTNGTTG